MMAQGDILYETWETNWYTGQQRKVSITSVYSAIQLNLPSVDRPFRYHSWKAPIVPSIVLSSLQLSKKTKVPFHSVSTPSCSASFDACSACSASSRALRREALSFANCSSILRKTIGGLEAGTNTRLISS